MHATVLNKKNNMARKKNYLNNKDLFKQVVLSKELGRMNDELAKMLTMLTARYGRHPNFLGYTYNDDMQAYAMMQLVHSWNSFNCDKYDNPFAYYTQSIKNSFYQFLNKEKKQRMVRDELLVDKGLNPSFAYMREHGANHDIHIVHDEEDHGQRVQDLQDVNEA